MSRIALLAAGLVAALALRRADRSDQQRDEADRHRRPRLHDHPEEGHRQGEDSSRPTRTRSPSTTSRTSTTSISTGPGVNKMITTTPFKGTKTVTVKLKKGTYRYVCDPTRP